MSSPASTSSPDERAGRRRAGRPGSGSCRRGLDLDAALATQLAGAPGGDDAAAVDDHDAVADQLDLARAGGS